MEKSHSFKKRSIGITQLISKPPIILYTYLHLICQIRVILLLSKRQNFNQKNNNKKSIVSAGFLQTPGPCLGKIPTQATPMHSIHCIILRHSVFGFHDSVSLSVNSIVLKTDVLRPIPKLVYDPFVLI
jgi:hypothetical protein